jgi:hypothetical protein
MAFAGLLQMGLEVGMDAILVKPKRQIGPFVAQVTIREEHHDSMEITEQPVEQGASVTDHAFKRPAELVVDAAWSTTPNSNAVGSSSSLLGSLAGAVTGTIGGVTDLAGQVGAATGNLMPAVGQLSDVVTQPLTVAKEFASNTMTDIGQTLSGAVNDLVPDLSGVGGNLTGIADQIVTNVPGGVAGALETGQNLVSDALGSLSGGLDPSSLVDGLTDALPDFSGGIDGVASAQAGEGTGQPKDIYAKFLALQASAVPFDVFTGKRSYTNMLIADMTTVTDKTTENALYLRLRLKEIIIVQSATQSSVSAAQDDQEAPEDTAASADQGDQQLTDAPNYDENAGDESIAADESSPPVEAGG